MVIRPHVKVVVTEHHNLDKIRGIIKRFRPNVLTLESSKPTINNRVLRHAGFLIKNGWKKQKIELKTKILRNKKKAMMHTFSITLKKTDEMQKSR